MSEMSPGGGVRSKAAERTGHGSFLPLLLLALAILGWSVFQTVALERDHRQLRLVLTEQRPETARASQLRNSLSQLASDTQVLADQGDAGAQVIVTQLKKRGITIHPNAAPPTLP